MLYNDTGIVIKQINFGEYDRILSIITANHGKISTIAKGVRRINSRKSSACELFVESKFSFVETKGLDLITESVIQDSYSNIKDQFDGTTSLFYISELIDYFIEEGNTLYSFSVYSLLHDYLASVDGDMDSLHKFVRAFEIKLISFLGVAPDFYNCAGCGRQLSAKLESYRYLFEGGLVCDCCRREVDSGEMLLSKNALKSLRFFAEQKIANAAKLWLSDELKIELKNFNQNILQNFHGFPIKSKSIFKI